MTKLSEIRKWVAERNAAGEPPSLDYVAHIIRDRFCKHRRFGSPVYILRNGPIKRVYGDAFSEELLGERDDVASMCARWPMTKECARAIAERRQFWSDKLGIAT